MRYYISLSAGGMSYEAISENISAITSALEQRGDEAVSSFTRATPEAVAGQALTDEDFARLMEVEFRDIDTCQALIALVQNRHVGRGQRMEVPYGIAKGLPTIGARHEAGNTLWRPFVCSELVYRTAPELGQLILAMPSPFRSPE